MPARPRSDRSAAAFRRRVEASWGDAAELSLIVVQLRQRRSGSNHVLFQMVETRILELTSPPAAQTKARSGGGARSSRSASSKSGSSRAKSTRTTSAAARAAELESEQKKLKLELKRARSKIKKLEDDLADAEADLADADAEIEDLERKLASKARPDGKLYQQVGLDPDCEDWVFAAVKKAFVTRFHPDANRAATAAERRQLERRFAAVYPVFDDLTKSRSRRRR